MTATHASQVLLERLIATNGFAVRKSIKGEAFWYTSGKPGPFYINTENIAGECEAERILKAINEILQTVPAKEAQTKAVFGTIKHLIDTDEAFNASIDALADYYLSHSSYCPTMIAGGERRDWFFSIPLAKKLQLPHICLFKSRQHHVTDHEGNSIEPQLQGQKVLHVADIINLASSYLNRWIPMLNELDVAFKETLSVAVRSQEGLENLKENHIAVVSPLIVDRPLFAEAYELGLINEFAYHEILMYYDSPKDWTRSFLKEADFGSSSASDDRKKERIQVFRNTDPYQLKDEFPLIFS